VGRCDGELRAITGGRVQQIIGLVELYVAREADQLESLGFPRMRELIRTLGPP